MFDDIARRFGLLALLCALGFAIIFSQNGVLDYIKIRRQNDAKDVSAKKLEEENIRLKAEIDRLQKDDRYLEDYTRKHVGLIKDGEKVYRIEK
jgi:cell division protein FtsB